MSELLRFFKDMRDNGYGLAEIAAQLGTSAIAEPVAGFAAMYDPVHGADAIREGMTYTPRTQEAQQYSQSIGNAANTAIKPAMPIIDTWKKGVDIAGQYSPVVGAGLRTVPTAIGIAMGAKPALQAGRQVSKSLGDMQARMIANANMPNTLNTAGFRGQRGAIGTLSTDDDLRALAKFNQMDDVYKFDNSHEYYDPIDKLVARNLSDDSFDFMELPTSYGKITITPSAKEKGKWQVTQWAKDGLPNSDSGNLTKEKALRTFFEDSRPELLAAPKRPLTEFEQAHLTAQRNAALPIEKGGLGLPANNTAMDRARAMGFDVDNPVYHGTKANINSFDNSRLGQATNAQSAKKAHFFSDSHNNSDYYSIRQAISREFDKSLELEKKYRELDAEWEQLDKLGASDDVLNDVEQKINKAKKEWRQEYDATRDRLTKEEGKSGVMNDYTTGANVLPVLVNKGDSLVFDQLGGRRSTTFSELLDDVIKTKKDSLVVNNTFDPYESTITAIVNPKNIRSRFAAFDPMQRQSSNLLATTAPLVPATALGAYMYNENRKKSQGKQ